ncbi:hypothetical protein ACP3S8_19970 [Mixta calida]|uniref:hypothetical protein n=1 Tax=Mixta calida TaxID=665913 RepID=UPI003CF6082E
MSKMTFVVEFEDGKEPVVGFTENFMGSGGKLCSVAFFDYKDDYFTEAESIHIADALEDAEWHGKIDEECASLLRHKLSLITQ